MKGAVYWMGTSYCTKHGYWPMLYIVNNNKHTSETHTFRTPPSSDPNGHVSRSNGETGDQGAGRSKISRAHGRNKLKFSGIYHNNSCLRVRSVSTHIYDDLFFMLLFFPFTQKMLPRVMNLWTYPGYVHVSTSGCFRYKASDAFPFIWDICVSVCLLLFL